MVREMPELQAADVTVESGYHHGVAIACMEAGLHIMVEKPMGITIRACDLMVETARGPAGSCLSPRTTDATRSTASPARCSTTAPSARPA